MKDHRLDLGRYVRNPFNRRGDIAKRLDFAELFQAKPDSGDYPWNPSRFTEQDLLKRSMTRKITLNPDLEYVGNTPFFDESKGLASSDYEVFDGIGRFNRREDYDFDNGRALTKQRPQQQPDYNPLWIDAYKISPTLKPGKQSKNPMPTMANPDPNNYLMQKAERRAGREEAGVLSVAQLLKGNNNEKKELPAGKEKEKETIKEKPEDQG
jgi:hypothetical protein|tara:strand:+ start:212 stop:841 length:630 start_codon:yes stop_codon:yes gene_type:complete